MPAKRNTSIQKEAATFDARRPLFSIWTASFLLQIQPNGTVERSLFLQNVF